VVQLLCTYGECALRYWGSYQGLRNKHSRSTTLEQSGSSKLYMFHNHKRIPSWPLYFFVFLVWHNWRGLLQIDQ
jgi:hypothetical protein